MLTWKIDVLVPQLRYEKKRLRATIRAAGNEIAGVTRRLIRAGGKSGRVYSKPGGGTYRASAPGQAPANRTGALSGNVKVFVGRGGAEVTVREMVGYAWILEHGRNSPLRKQFRRRVKGGPLLPVPTALPLLPRPSITRALAERAASIKVRIEQSVALDMKFVRMK